MELSKAAKEDLARSKLNRQIISAMGCFSVTEDHEQWLRKHGFSTNFPAGKLHELTEFYAIPYPQGFTRIKLLTDIETKDGKKAKYLQPSGKKTGISSALYYLEQDEWKFGNTKIPIVFTEGEKKVAKLSQELGDDYLAIGAPGVTQFDTDDWKKIKCSDRDIYIAYDRDAKRNANVEKAALSLYLFLWKKEMRPFFLKFKGEKVDDWLAKKRKPESAIHRAIEKSNGNRDFFSYGEKINRNYLGRRLVDLGYSRHDAEIMWKESGWSRKSKMGINVVRALMDRQRARNEREILKQNGREWIMVDDKGNKRVVSGKLARDMMEHYKGGILFHHGSFWTYNEEEGVWYEEDEGGRRVKGKIQCCLGDELAKKSIIEDAFYQMQNSCVPDERDFKFEREVGVLNLKNGVLDLDSLELMPHSKDYYFTNKINAAYNPDADCPHWKKFVRETELDQSTIDRLQEWFGYCLIPSRRVNKALYLIGNSGTGKSVIIETLEELLIEYRSALDPTTIFERFNTAMLHGKLINICTDADTTSFLDDRIKKVITGETLKAENKNRAGFEFKPHARFIFSANDFIATKDKSNGFFKRFDIIRLDKVWDGKKGKDDQLGEKIKKEIDGVLNWAIEGLKRLQKNKFQLTESQEVEANLDSYREEVNPLHQFLSSSCEVSQTHKTYSKCLYESYRNWCKMTGHIALSNSKMGREMHKIYPFVSTLREGSGSRAYYYPYLEMKIEYREGNRGLESATVNDAQKACEMSKHEIAKAEKNNKSGKKPPVNMRSIESAKPPVSAPVAAPVEKEVLGPYFAKGYDYTEKTDSRGKTSRIYYEKEDVEFHREWTYEKSYEYIASVFEKREKELLEESLSIDVWKERQSVVTPEMIKEAKSIEDQKTGEHSLFDENEYSQYDDERGQ